MHASTVYKIARRNNSYTSFVYAMCSVVFDKSAAVYFSFDGSTRSILHTLALPQKLANGFTSVLISSANQNCNYIKFNSFCRSSCRSWKRLRPHSAQTINSCQNFNPGCAAAPCYCQEDIEHMVVQAASKVPTK